ncbi:MAG TPA: hypothetical protein VHU91_04410 [Mycobacteriales bacterium]|jgi:hypothetical protein|nr:hypothetical protein [Mycobacteriales bacterium]
MAYRWYADESVLGLGKLLSRTREDITYPGHHGCPVLQLGTPDTDWMPYVAAQGWAAIHRDKRIRTRPAELKVFQDYGLRTIMLGGKKDMSSRDQCELMLRLWVQLENLIDRLGPGPWSLTVTTRGITETPWRPVNEAL